MLRSPGFVWLLGLGLLSRSPASSRSVPNVVAACDSLVKTRASDPLRYRQRGDRCEGVYGRDVGGSSNLLVASLVESFEAIDSSALPLRVEWTPPDGEAVLLRAYSIKPGLYYRMETDRPIAASPYVWPVDVLQALRIGNGDIGVVGTASPMMGSVRREVLVPLRIGHRKAPAHSARYRVTIWPGKELSDVFVTLATAGADGKPVTYLQRDEDLAYGFYPAERAVDIRLKPLTARGIYYVLIAATLKGGGSATSEFLLFHPGPPPGSGNQ